MDQQCLIGEDVAEHETQAELAFLAALVLSLMEARSGFQQQGDAVGLSLALVAEPTLFEVGLRVGHQAVRRIGNIDFAALNLVNDDKVLLLPVDDARQGRLVAQLFEGDRRGQSAQADLLGRLADAIKGDPVAGQLAEIAESLQSIAPAMETGHHAQTRRSAIHRIMLVAYGEGHRRK